MGSGVCFARTTEEEELHFLCDLCCGGADSERVAYNGLVDSDQNESQF